MCLQIAGQSSSSQCHGVVHHLAQVRASERKDRRPKLSRRRSRLCGLTGINDTVDVVGLLESLRDGLVKGDTRICARERGRERGLRMHTER